MRDHCIRKVVPAGRRSGKSERGKRYLARQAMRVKHRYFAGAPTHDQAKRIFWEDLKLLTFAYALGENYISEGELKIWLPNGSTIQVLGFDKPQRFEGEPWGGGLIDEFGNLKPGAWEENISPALDTLDPRMPDYLAWVWLMGVPEGLNFYFDISEYARTSGNPNWRNYHWKSADILTPAQIEEAKRTRSLRQFKQEYEASFEGASGRIYEDYSDANLTSETIGSAEQLHWMHDFNYTPMSSAIAVLRAGRQYVLDEIILTSAVARQAAIEFVERYQNHTHRHVMLYGDPAGKAGEKHGQVSNYTEIEKVLRASGWTVTRKVKAAAPAIRDRQNAVRARICNAAGDRTLFCNPSRAKYAHKGLQTVQLMKGSAFIEQPSEFQHVTTAIGYWIDYEWPVLVDTGAPQPTPVVPIPSVSHFGRGR